MQSLGSDELLEVVNAHSRSAVIEGKDFKVIFSERGGRILGIFLGDSPNLLWVNPKIEEVLEEGGWNVGGERLWISPERNFFYKNPERFEEWFCPPELDPGEYKIVEATNDRVLIEGKISAYDNLLKTPLEASIRREISLMESRKWLRLRVREGIIGKYQSRVNPWILTQVPMSYSGAGTVLIPVKKNAEPVHYFGEIPKDRLKVSRDHVSFKIDGNFVAKLGIRPEDLREPGYGVIAYLSRIEKRTWAALVLVSHDLPLSQEDCLDVAKADPSLPRAAVQSYNSGPEAFSDVKFGEIELQMAPTMNIQGDIFATAEYDLIAFTGTKKEVLAKAKRLIKVQKPKLY